MRYQQMIESAANGSTGQVELSKKFLDDIDIVIPAKVIVDKFSDFVSPVVNKIASKETESEILTKLRDWLLPMLMNGQVAVNS
jgi:type I restriction enzyme S subunit